MQLLYSLASPYARLVRVVSRYLAITDIQEVIVNPFDNRPILVNSNPLAKVPCLILNEGDAIFDSEVIVRYLDHEFGNNQLFPRKIDWQSMTAFSMIKGLLDSAVGLRQEQMREQEGVRSPFWTKRFTQAIHNTLNHIEKTRAQVYQSCQLDVEQMALVVALEYIEFRHPQLEWQQDCVELAFWFKQIRNQAVFIETRPF
ncbi:MAG: glutathione S-transferase N-terminal domain-containing protein [Parashewanella sp.]